MILDYVLYLVGFILLIFIQALVINGIHSAFKGGKIVDDLNNKVSYQGNVFYNLSPKFFEKYKYTEWAKPLWSCVKCMSSVWGGITFWTFIIWLFDFRLCEIPIFIADVFALSYVNFYFYKKV